MSARRITLVAYCARRHGATQAISAVTPLPKVAGDERLPHIADKVHKQIQKTALVPRRKLVWRHADYIKSLWMSSRWFQPTPTQNPPPDKVASLSGNEVDGAEAVY